MRNRHQIEWALLLMLALAGMAVAADQQGFVDWFEVPRERFASIGRNRYFVLEPGSVYEYAGVDEGKPVKLVITVTKQTKTIDGVETRVVEEREWNDGKLIEVSLNYFALDKFTKDIYYFGEDVDTYKDEKLDGHEGTWHSGVDDAHYGMFMPAKPKVGQKFYQELAAKVAMDRFEIVATAETKKVPAGSFGKCVKTRETTPLEPANTEFKLYAPGVGLIVDGALELVKYPKPQVERDGKPVADEPKPLIPIDEARAALDLVGVDPNAEAVWAEAINDPNLSDHARQDLIEDLNENGFPDPDNVTMDDLPLVMNRLELIEQLAPDAMDQVNADAFDEAYKDLINMFDKLTGQ